MSLANNELSVLDSTLAEYNKNLQRMNDLALQAANGTNNAQNLESIKQEVDEITKNLVSLGNTKFNGAYIFAGTNTTTPPLQEDGNGGYTYTGTPSTKDYQRYIQISDGIQVCINTTADTLFGEYDPVAGTGSGAIETAMKLSEALGTGDTDAIISSLDGLNAAMDTALQARSKFGAVSNQFEMTKNSIDVNMIQLKSFKSGLEDIDYTEAISQLLSQEYTLQATMAVSAKTLQTGLLNYI
jgi:flagellar hook-associated protein 3 FlgL